MNVYHKSNISYNNDILLLEERDISNYTKLGLPNDYQGQQLLILPAYAF